MKLLLDAIHRCPTARRYLDDAQELRRQKLITECDYLRLVAWLIRAYGPPEQIARLERIEPQPALPAGYVDKQKWYRYRTRR
jgi:hypothetical protein